MPLTQFGALVLAKPTEAARLILKALDRGGGDRKRAALLLNVPVEAIYVAIKKLGMWDDIDRMIAMRGYIPTCDYKVARRKPVEQKTYGYTTTVDASVAKPAPRRHSPVRFDVFDPQLADDEDGWRQYP